MFQDRKIKRLLRSAGGKGFTIYIYLLTNIYRDKGYFYEWDEHSAFDISDELNFSENVVEETVRACCSIGLFNEDLYAEKSVISSESIQQRWQKIVTDANRVETDIDPALEITGGKPLFLTKKKGKPPQETPEKSRETPQSKGKERKVKKSKEDHGARVKGCPIPEELQVEGFKERYEAYWEYMTETKQQRSSIPAVESHFRKLIALKEKGNDPLAVIDQTISAGNKSFYPLKDNQFESNDENNGKEQSVDIKGISDDIDEILADRKASAEASGSD